MGYGLKRRKPSQGLYSSVNRSIFLVDATRDLLSLLLSEKFPWKTIVLVFVARGDPRVKISLGGVPRGKPGPVLVSGLCAVALARATGADGEGGRCVTV